MGTGVITSMKNVGGLVHVNFWKLKKANPVLLLATPQNWSTSIQYDIRVEESNIAEAHRPTQKEREDGPGGQGEVVPDTHPARNTPTPQFLPPPPSTPLAAGQPPPPLPPDQPQRWGGGDGDGPTRPWRNNRHPSGDGGGAEFSNENHFQLMKNFESQHWRLWGEDTWNVVD